MAPHAYSPAAWVQLSQALIARELVDSFGLPERKAAEILGIAPSAVSQYLSGKRLGGATGLATLPESSRTSARRAAQRLAESPGDSSAGLEAVLTVAREVARRSGGPTRRAPLHQASPGTPQRDRELRKALRQRIANEQAAVGECMRLAQRSRDELTRAVFRQIASDSLRHAEIVASIQTYLERGLYRAYASGVRRADIERLIRREREAESDGPRPTGPEFGGMIEVLWQSMEADERKHEALLDALLERGLPPAEASPPRKTGRRTDTT
jgi:predicted transcriptional regulator